MYSPGGSASMFHCVALACRGLVSISTPLMLRSSADQLWGSSMFRIVVAGLGCMVIPSFISAISISVGSMVSNIAVKTVSLITRMVKGLSHRGMFSQHTKR